MFILELSFMDAQGMLLLIYIFTDYVKKIYTSSTVND